LTFGETAAIETVHVGACPCHRYDVTATTFEGDCTEFAHTPEADLTTVADKVIDELNHFERGSCTPRGWFDFYFEVTAAMIAAEDNLLFEVEVLGGVDNNDAVSLHLYEGVIPLDREAERVSIVPDNNIYAIGLSSQDIHQGTYYLGVHCGESAQRFRAVIMEVCSACEHALAFAALHTFAYRAHIHMPLLLPGPRQALGHRRQGAQRDLSE
jgi:hypothetical protein